MLPTDYQSLIALSRYARYLPDERRRELWPETVRRYIKNVVEPKVNDEKLVLELEQAILNLEVMPSMRALMTAGEALDRDHMAGYNPVSGDTLVLTKEFGNVPISELANKEVTVLNKDGSWTSAFVRSYGVQPVLNVKLKLNSNTERTVKATANHRWLRGDGVVTSTSGLVIGDNIPFASAPKPEVDADYLLGVKHGLVYGDGTAVRSHGRVKGYHIRLCGQSRELIRYFSEYPTAYPASANGDPVVQMYDTFAATHDLKSLPVDETPSYTLGFIRGWFAADGSVSAQSSINICVTDEGRDWLYKNAETVGWVVQSSYEYSNQTNFGMRTRRQWSVKISRSSVTEDDMLCSWKAAALKPLSSKFVVSGVEDSGEMAEVFCAEVPDTNTFVLSGGLVTGNCSFVAVDHPRAFDEILYILTCGTGVGFSCEQEYVRKLPEVAETFHKTDTTIVVGDSRIGWASSFRELVAMLYAGKIPTIDVSKVRQAGERLKTFGGRASGPQPLLDLFNHCIDVFQDAAGRKLTDIEVHSIVCKIGEIVVVGGVRRSALISLSDLGSHRMRTAKAGQWWEQHPEFALANNSAVYNEAPEPGQFMEEWKSIYDSKSGERGIYYRGGIRNKTADIGRRDPDLIVGVNPCGEIALRSAGLCNLTEAVVKEHDTLDSLARKVYLCTVLGTIQSTYTDFRYVRSVWKKNAEEERLLGVSLTGIFDNKLTSGQLGEKALVESLDYLREVAIGANVEWAAKLGINKSGAITTIKPSGSVSQLVDAASGIHPRHSKFYIRAIRQDNKDPMTQFLKDQGVPFEPCVMKPDSTTVFFFPVKAPDASLTRDDVDALKHLDLWRIYNKHWSEHQVSVTVNLKEEEWVRAGAWVFDNFEEISGISFLPYDGGTYRQAPYTEVTQEEYEAHLAKMPEFVDWNRLVVYEMGEDFTTGTQTLACTALGCEI